MRKMAIFLMIAVLLAIIAAAVILHVRSVLYMKGDSFNSSFEAPRAISGMILENQTSIPIILLPNATHEGIVSIRYFKYESTTPFAVLAITGFGFKSNESAGLWIHMPINISNGGHGISMEILNQSNTSREIEANMSGAAVMYTLEQIRSKYACGSLLMGYTNRSYNMSYVSTLLKQGNAVCFNYFGQS